jgi:Ion channel
MDLRDIGLSHAITVIVTSVAVIASVLFHYEGLNWLGKRLQTRLLHHRAKVAALIFGQLGLHIAEIWLFALGYWFLLNGAGFGEILPPQTLGILDLVYFSATSYTTIGFGDMVPVGAIRFLVGTEALLGLVLITWSASFTFLEMQRYWGRD